MSNNINVLWGEAHISIEEAIVPSVYLDGVLCNLDGNILSEATTSWTFGKVTRTLEILESDVPENTIPAINIWVWYREANSLTAWEIRPQSAVAIGAGVNLSIPRTSDKWIDLESKFGYERWFRNWPGGYTGFARWMWWDQINYNGRIYKWNIVCPYCALNTSSTANQGQRGFFFPSVRGLANGLADYRSDWGLSSGLFKRF